MEGMKNHALQYWVVPFTWISSLLLVGRIFQNPRVSQVECWATGWEAARGESNRNKQAKEGLTHSTVRGRRKEGGRSICRKRI